MITGNEKPVFSKSSCYVKKVKCDDGKCSAIIVLDPKPWKDYVTRIGIVWRLCVLLQNRISSCTVSNYIYANVMMLLSFPVKKLNII